MLNQPTSSPMMKMMLGLRPDAVVCATAEVNCDDAAEAATAVAASAVPRSSIARRPSSLRAGSLLMDTTPQSDWLFRLLMEPNMEWRRSGWLWQNRQRHCAICRLQGVGIVAAFGRRTASIS